MKKFFTEHSHIILDSVLKTQNIYFCNKFPITPLLKEFSIVNRPNLVRYRWMFDATGFYPNIVGHNTFIKRADELLHSGDNLNSLRQRIAIIHSMIECKFDTLVPVHISVIPKERGQKIELDLNDIDSVNRFNFIAHPGQTRAQASYMMQDELRNVFFYIHKSDAEYIDLKPSLPQIVEHEDFLQYYKPSPLQNLEYDKVLVDLFLPGHEDGTKRHGPSNMRILKSNTIMYLKEGRPNSRYNHPNNSYVVDSFIKMNSYCSILFNNEINIYSDNINQASKLFTNNRSELIAEGLKIVDNKETLTSNRKLWNKVGSKFYSDSSGLQRFTHEDRDNYALQLENKTNLNYVIENLNENDKDTLLQLKAIRNKYPLKPRDRFSPIYIEDSRVELITGVEDLQHFVEVNKYKGICVVIKTEHITLNRDLGELLITIPASHSLCRTSDNSLFVINCEHEFWKTSNNFTEYLYTDKFLNFKL